MRQNLRDGQEEGEHIPGSGTSMSKGAGERKVIRG